MGDVEGYYLGKDMMKLVESRRNGAKTARSDYVEKNVKVKDCQGGLQGA